MATRRWHAAADEPWLQLTRPRVTHNAYRAQLARAYGFVSALDDACDRTPELVDVVDRRQLSRSTAIASDLMALGMTPPYARCTTVPMMRSLREGLGWLYVLERESLLHDRVRNHLVTLPDLGGAFAYLSTFRNGAIEHWEKFGKRLERTVGSDVAEQQIIDAAQLAFDRLIGWNRSEGASNAYDNGAHCAPLSQTRE